MQSLPAGWTPPSDDAVNDDVVVSIPDAAWLDGPRVLDTFSVKRELVAPLLPGQVRSDAGLSVASGDCSFDYSSTDGAPWRAGPARVTTDHTAHLYAQSESASIPVGTFTVNDATAALSAPVVSLGLVDEKLATRQVNRFRGGWAESHTIESAWLVDQMARELGYYATPPPVDSCVLSVPFTGSPYAEVPALGEPTPVAVPSSWDDRFGSISPVGPLAYTYQPERPIPMSSSSYITFDAAGEAAGVSLFAGVADGTGSFDGTGGTITMSSRTATLNAHGGYHGDWPARIPMLAALVVAAEPRVLITQELHEHLGEHTQFLAALRTAGGTHWHMVEADRNDHFYYDSRYVTPVGPVQLKTLNPSGGWSSQKFRDLETGIEFSSWNTHMRAGDTAARNAQARNGMTDWINALGPRIGGGDLNNWDTNPGTPLQILRDSGNVSTRELVDEVVNGQYDSHDNWAPNKMRGRWIDHLFAGGGVTVTATGLIDTGDASDHNMIWADFQYSILATSEMVGVMVGDGGTLQIHRDGNYALGSYVPGLDTNHPHRVQVEVQRLGQAGAWTGVRARARSAAWAFWGDWVTESTLSLAQFSTYDTVGVSASTSIGGLQITTVQDDRVWDAPTARIQPLGNMLRTAATDAGADPWAAIQAVAASNLGAAYVDAAGVLNVRNYDWLHGARPIDAALVVEDDLDDLDWTLATEDVADRIEVTYRPIDYRKSTPSTDPTVWEASEAYEVGPGETLEITFDVDGLFANNLAWWLPDWATNYPAGKYSRIGARLNRDGTGPQQPQSALRVGSYPINSSRVRLTLTNNTARRLFTVDAEGNPSLIIRVSEAVLQTGVAMVATGPPADQARNTLTVDLGIHCQRDEDARRILALIAETTKAASFKVSSVLVPFDWRRELGDIYKLTDEVSGLDVKVLCVGIDMQGAPGNYTQKLDLALLEVSFFDFNHAWDSVDPDATFADFDAMFDDDATLGDFDRTPLTTPQES